MGRTIDADSHFMEPLDLWARYIDPAYRSRCLEIRYDERAGLQVGIEGRTLPPGRARSTLQGFAIGVAYGQKERGGSMGSFEASAVLDGSLEDMDERIRFLDREGFDCQIIFPTLGLVWEGLVEEPELAAAHCRAYNRWALETCAAYPRLHPLGHVSLRNPPQAVKEIEHLSAQDVRAVFVAALPPGGRSLGHPDFDAVWAAAEALDISVCLHLVVHDHYLGSDWHRDRNPGFMFLSMNSIQDPRMALTTMIYDGVFERFPRLRVATVEAGSGWVPEWLDRFDYRYSYMGHSCPMERSASETFARNVWVCADPTERTLPYTLELVGDDKFFIGSDFPHAEGFTDPVGKARELLAKLPPASVDRVLGENATSFFRV